MIMKKKKGNGMVPGSSPVEQSKKNQLAFIQEYVNNGGFLIQAALKVGIDPNTARVRWFKDPEFLEELRHHMEQWHEELRAAAMERARKKSDILLIFLLKSIRPDLYDDEVRRQVWLDRNGIQDSSKQPLRAVLVREEPPTIDLSKSTDAEG